MHLKNLKENNTSPKYLYLDQMFWINLARVHYRKDVDINLSRILNKLNTAVSIGKLIIPMNLTNVMETQKRRNPQQREKLAKFMVSLSKGFSFVPYPFIEKLEVENIVLEKLGFPLHNIRELAFGKGILYLISNGTPNFLPKFYGSPISLINETKELMAKKILSEESIKEESIINFIINPRTNHNFTKLMNKFEKIRAEGYNIKDKILKKKIGISQYIIKSIAPILYQACIKNGCNPEDFRLNEEKKIYDFVKNLPFFYTQYILLKGLDESPDHKIISNDILDNNSFCFALPYCDYVAGENYVINLAKRNSINELYSTKLFKKSDFIEIEKDLDELITD